MDMVLEIGGGHNPYPQSDVIVDKFLENKERGGDLKVDGRAVVIADFQQLPFRDGSFSYAICSHVLEHVESVGAALGELTRVAKEGYLETPSALTELTEPHRDYHRWYVIRQGAKLLFYPKQPQVSPQQSLLNRLLSRNFGFKVFFLSNPDLGRMRLWWKGKVEYQVFPDSSSMELDKLFPDINQSLGGVVTGLARHYGEKLKRRAQEKKRIGKAPVDIESILCCPVCKTPLRVEGNKLHCSKCAGHYLKDGRLYHLLAENLIPG